MYKRGGGGIESLPEWLQNIHPPPLPKKCLLAEVGGKGGVYIISLLMLAQRRLWNLTDYLLLAGVHPMGLSLLKGSWRAGEKQLRWTQPCHGAERGGHLPTPSHIFLARQA